MNPKVPLEVHVYSRKYVFLESLGLTTLTTLIIPLNAEPPIFSNPVIFGLFVTKLQVVIDSVVTSQESEKLDASVTEV